MPGQASSLIYMLSKILLLENDIDIEPTITGILKVEGFITSITKFNTIIKDAVKFVPDLIIMGTRQKTQKQMTTLCKLLRADRPTVYLPILFFSSRPNLEAFAEQCDATAYITKPFEMIDFCKTVKDVLSF
jgi:DNA-binding response OmpR family regulator